MKIRKKKLKSTKKQTWVDLKSTQITKIFKEMEKILKFAKIDKNLCKINIRIQAWQYTQLLTGLPLNVSYFLLPAHRSPHHLYKITKIPKT